MNVRYFEKRPGAWHLDFRVDGARFRPYGGPTEAQAIQGAAATIAAAIAAPKKPTAATVATKDTGPTLEQAYSICMTVRSKWLESRNKVGLQTTFDAIGLPDEPLANMTRDRVRALRVQWMAEPGKSAGTTLSASTVNHRLSMLTVLLDACDLPPHGVKHLSVRGNNRTRRFSDDEVAAMQQWCAEHAHRRGAGALADLIILGLDLVAREGELLGLAWADVGPKTVTFRRTKNGDTRSVPLTPRCAALLGARRALPAPFSDLGQSQLGCLWSDMRKALGHASDPEFVFHTLRHEGISRLVERPGISPFTVQAIAGHSSIKTTQGYAHASHAAMDAAINPQGAPA